MAHPEGEAEDVGNPADSPEDAFNAIADEMLGGEQEEEIEEVETDAVEAEETDELTEEDVPDEAADDDTPPIEPPNSLTAEEKEAFKSLPRVGQEMMVRRIGELEKGFQTKAQEAAQVKQTVQQQALERLAEIERDYSERIQHYAQRFEVAAPDPSLLAEGRQQEYLMQMAAYQQATAQRTQAQQEARQLAEQAAQRETEAMRLYAEEQQRIIAQAIPEYSDPEAWPKLQQELTSIAHEIGYAPEQIAEARATDILAMKKVAEWKADHIAYRKLMKSKMERVRQGKEALPKVARPGQATGQAQNRSAKAQAAFERAKTSQGSARVSAFEEYLTNSGHL